MRKLFLFLSSALLSLTATAQVNQYFWYNGKLLIGNPISQIDSITFQNDAQVDSITLYLPHTVMVEKRDTVIIHDTIYMPCPNADDNDNGNCEVKSGVFSVSKSKKVNFAPGNLQYNAVKNKWRFAPHTYDTIGAANVLVSPTYDGWIDLFGWGTGDRPIDTTYAASAYSSFVDWGTNPIGTFPANTWHTLTNAEWRYLFISRPNAQQLFTFATIGGIKGIIIFPDDWNTPTSVNLVLSTNQGLEYQGGLYYNSTSDNYSHNMFTLEQWTILEDAGAIFLPAAGIIQYHPGFSSSSLYVDNLNSVGYYYSSSLYNSTTPYHVLISNNYFKPSGYARHTIGTTGYCVSLSHRESVRLVRTIQQ